jgi:hypothetical protein
VASALDDPSPKVTLPADQTRPAEAPDGVLEGIAFLPILRVADAGETGLLEGHQGRVLAK